MNNYKLEIKSQGDKISGVLTENGTHCNIFYGKTNEVILQQAKDYVEYLKANPLQSEIIWKDGDKKITYYIRGIEEWMVLFEKKTYNIEAKTLVNKEGHIYHSFSDALEALKSVVFEETKIKTIIL